MFTRGTHPILKSEVALFADCKFSDGDTVAYLGHLPTITENNKYAMTIRKGLYLNTVGTDYQYVNHSCEPNMRFCTASLRFVAERDIKPGDMLTFDYTRTEFEMASPFKCVCGTRSCKGVIDSQLWSPAALSH